MDNIINIIKNFNTNSLDPTGLMLVVVMVIIILTLVLKFLKKHFTQIVIVFIAIFILYNEFGGGGTW